MKSCQRVSLVLVAPLLGCWGNAYLDGQRRETGDTAGSTSAETTGASISTSSGDSSGSSASTGGDNQEGSFGATTGASGTTSGEVSDVTSAGGTATSLSSGEDTGGEGSSGDGSSTTAEPDPLVSAPEGACADAARTSKSSWIFVTDEVVAGDLDPPMSWKNTNPGFWAGKGVVRGDRICQCAAFRGNLAGRFVAWLSISTQSLEEFLSLQGLGQDERNFVLPNMMCVAASWQELKQNDLKNPIHATPGFGYGDWHVWTGTNEAAKIPGMPAFCNDWTNGTGLPVMVGDFFVPKSNRGDFGVSTSVNKWADADGEDSCDSKNKLYCIQVADEGPADVGDWCPKP